MSFKSLAYEREATETLRKMRKVESVTRPITRGVISKAASSAPPPSRIAQAVTPIAGGLQFRFTETGVSAGHRLYRSTSNVFKSATLLDFLPGSPTGDTTLFYQDMVGSGAFYYWVTSVNEGGIESQPLALQGSSNSVVTGIAANTGLVRLAAQHDKTDDVVAIIGSGSDVLRVSLLAATSYRFRAVLFVEPDAVGGHAYSISRSGTVTSEHYHILSIDDALATVISTPAAASNTVGSAVGSTAALTVIEGALKSLSAGLLWVNFAQAVVSGTSSVLPDSYFEVVQVG